MIKILATIALVLGLACGGGGGSTSTTPVTPPPVTPPAKTTYGTFRTLKPHTTSALSISPSIVGAEKALATVVSPVTAGPVVTTMQNPRYGHRSILMMNGKVLVIGGVQAAASTSLDIFDPATETFTPSKATLSIPRKNRIGSEWNDYWAFGVTNLPPTADYPQGRVAIMGNWGSGNSSGANIDLYDPATDTITTVLSNTAYYAVEEIYYIGDNKLLVSSGSLGLKIQDLVNEDPNPNADPTQPYIHYLTTYPIPHNDMYEVLVFSASVQDATGNIWFFGGQQYPANNLVSSIWKYDVSAGTVTRQGELTSPRSHATAVLLANGKIGIYGGVKNSMSNLLPVDTVEIFDTATKTLTLSSPLVGGRCWGDSVFLQTGYTLYAGGMTTITDPEKASNPFQSAQSSELAHKWDATPVFSGSTGSMTKARMNHSVTSLPNGLVLITGGMTDTATDDNTAEIYDPMAKLYIAFKTETVVVNTQMALTTDYAAGVTYAVSDPLCSIDATGLLTVGDTNATIITVTATAKDDPTLTATIQLKVIKI